jgi:hypothetical protein
VNINERSNRAWNVFMEKKSEFPGLVLALCDKITANGKTIKFIRCNNAGYNTPKLQGGCAEGNITA